MLGMLAHVQVKGFSDQEETDAWMLDNIDTTIAAVHFDMDLDKRFVGYTVQTNATVRIGRRAADLAPAG